MSIAHGDAGPIASPRDALVDAVVLDAEVLVDVGAHLVGVEVHRIEPRRQNVVVRPPGRPMIQRFYLGFGGRLARASSAGIAAASKLSFAGEKLLMALSNRTTILSLPAEQQRPVGTLDAA